MMFGGSAAAVAVLASQRNQGAGEGSGGGGDGGGSGQGLGLIGLTVVLMLVTVLMGVLFGGMAVYETARNAQAFRASAQAVTVHEPVLAVPVTQRRWCDKHGTCTLLDDYATADTLHYRLTNNLGVFGCDASYPGHDGATGPGPVESLSSRIGQPAEVAGYVVRANGPWDLVQRCNRRLMAGPDGLVTVDGKVVVLIR